MDAIAAADSVTFGPWRYDRRPGRLFRQQAEGRWEPASIGSRAAEILAVLAREPGALVAKDTLMDAVWPGVAVEANNLTVQVAALRRVLDDGIAAPSYIQTVPGRGYRLLCAIDELTNPVVSLDPDADTVSPTSIPAIMSAPSRIPRGPLTIGAVALVAVLIAVTTYLAWPGSLPAPPRLSALVLPFENFGGADDAKIAAALTDDLKSTLSLTTPVQIVNPKTSLPLNDRSMPVEVFGRQAGARYVIAGSERRLGDVLRINAELVASETGKILWIDRFDVSASDPAAGQDQAILRLQFGIYKALIPLEAARSQTERPANPDALDLSLRAKALELIPPTPSRSTEIRVFYERALQLEPMSAHYQLMLVSAMLDDEDQNPHGRKAVYERTASLLAAAQASEPGLWFGRFVKLYWVAWQENRRCPEVVDLAERFLTSDAKVGAVSAIRWLAGCYIVLGRADKAVAVMTNALKIAPSAYRSRDYRNLQFALLLLGRYDESIQAGERALAENPDDVNWERARLNLRLAAAYALAGRIDEAKRKLAEATRINPLLTLRGTTAAESGNPVYAAQLGRVRDGLQLAGLRDHAEEDADFGVPSDRHLHQESEGRTPLTVPGAEMIRTDALVTMLAKRHPIVIDASANFSGSSLPGAIGLRYVGAGGDLHDLAQDRLRTTMRELTKGDVEATIVAVGWNSEGFDGRNLAVRLVALGYTQVVWYRGGREAWEVRGLPESMLAPHDW